MIVVSKARNGKREEFPIALSYRVKWKNDVDFSSGAVIGLEEAESHVVFKGLVRSEVANFMCDSASSIRCYCKDLFHFAEFSRVLHFNLIIVQT